MDELLEILTDRGWAVVDIDNVAYVGIVITSYNDGERSLSITVDGEAFRNAMRRIRAKERVMECEPKPGRTCPNGTGRSESNEGG